MPKKFLFLIGLFFAIISCQSSIEPTPTENPYAAINEETFAANARLMRSVNLGNSLEGPNEGAWGLFLKEEYFVDIGEAGFDAVRVPIRWSKYTDVHEPYTIQNMIFDRIDWVIEQAFANDLAVIINVHHFDAIMQMPEGQSARLAGIWRQIAERYQDYPNDLYFEILNEPHEKLDNELWNQIFPESLAEIRKTNPERYVIIGGDQWNSLNGLETLELPEDDRRIISTFHYYSPHEFTHQGAPWSSVHDVADLPWGSEADVVALTADFDKALAWSDKEQRPLLIGEFGAFYAAPMDSRVIWTSTVRAEAEKRDFSWAYWDFGTGFAVYNLSTQEWREPILRALIPEN